MNNDSPTDQTTIDELKQQIEQFDALSDKLFLRIEGLEMQVASLLKAKVKADVERTQFKRLLQELSTTQGEKGSPGPSGEKGSPGRKGSPGVHGSTGPRGSQGTSFEKGGFLFGCISR